MFDFFEGLIEKLGVKLISDFTNKLYDWIENIKNNSKGENNNNSSDGAQIGSSGYWAQIGSSGNRAQIGSSGDGAQIGSSGDGAQIGSSGNRAQIGSSGNRAQIGSSGYWAQIGSSGYWAQIGSSGNRAQIDISGENSIGFACGYKTIIKAKNGTWVSLAEYGKDEQENITPVFAKCAQIGNKEYKDYKGKTLKEDTYYILWNKEFYTVENYDEIWTIKLSEHKRENIKIIKAIDIDDLLEDEIKEIYIAIEGNLSAHGYTMREAIEDLTLKKLDNINKDEIIAEIKKKGKVTRSQYRALTGACSFGTNKFCETHNIQNLEEIELDKLRKILINDYGAKEFWKMIDGKEVK